VFLLYVFLFVCFVRSTISGQSAGRFTPKFACGRTLVPDVSSPLLGVSGPRRTEKGGNEIFVTRESMGNFCILAVLERYLSNAWTDPHQFLLVSADVPPCGVHRPLGAGEEELKTQKIVGVSFVHRTATISIFLSVTKCGPICTAQTCAHSGVEPSTSAKAFLQGGPKSSKKFRIFHYFETLRPYISDTIKNRGI